MNPPIEMNYLHKEDCEEHDALNESRENDGNGQDVTSCAGVTASSFSCFHSEKADGDRGSKSCKTDVELTFDSGEEEHEEFVEHSSI